MLKKKTLLITTIVLIMTILFSAATSICAYADDDNFEPRLTAPNSSIAYYSKKKNVYFQTGTGMPNCVAYAYGRIYEMNGEKPLLTHGSAGDWYSMNKRGGYYPYGQTPKLGAIACWSNHVAVVEKINKDGSITISESHWHGKYFNTKTYKNVKSHYGQKFYGYIYAYNGGKDSMVKKETNKQYKTEQMVATANINNEFNMIKLNTSKKPVEKKKLSIPALSLLNN